jgi:putative methyltransferase (TIGR04325 family)
VSPKRLLQSLTPPLLWSVGKAVKRKWFRSVDRYSYAPDGWSTRLPRDAAPEDYWTARVRRDRADCEALIAQMRKGQLRMTECGEYLKRIIFAYVLALVARDHHALSILDYGGGLGEDYWVGRALVPAVALDYHCKEFPTVAAAGRELSPDIKWHTDDACLQQQYDLVMFSSSLQYLPDWKQMLRLAAVAARRHLFITDIPVVRAVLSGVATERSASGINVHWLLNRDEIIGAANDAGFTVIQEIAMGDYPEVAGAPEQPTCIALLFERRATENSV